MQGNSLDQVIGPLPIGAIAGVFGWPGGIGPMLAAAVAGAGAASGLSLLREPMGRRYATPASFNLHGNPSSMPNTMESLICEEDLSCDVSTLDDGDAMPSRGGVVAHPLVTIGRAPIPEHATAAASPLRPQLFVTVLEAGDDALLVRWVESGRCHYGEQRWRLRVALQPGRCALSGQPIEPGEPVFRPVRRPVPANGDEMIRLAALPGMDGAACDATPEDGDARHPAEVHG